MSREMQGVFLDMVEDNEALPAEQREAAAMVRECHMSVALSPTSNPSLTGFPSETLSLLLGSSHSGAHVDQQRDAGGLVSVGRRGARSQPGAAAEEGGREGCRGQRHRQPTLLEARARGASIGGIGGAGAPEGQRRAVRWGLARGRWAE